MSEPKIRDSHNISLPVGEGERKEAVARLKSQGLVTNEALEGAEETAKRQASPYTASVGAPTAKVATKVEETVKDDANTDEKAPDVDSKPVSDEGGSKGTPEGENAVEAKPEPKSGVDLPKGWDEDSRGGPGLTKAELAKVADDLGLDIDPTTKRDDYIEQIKDAM